jgi:hypothetical protein
MTHIAMRKADRFTSIALAALGVAMFVGGYRMDRLEIRQIPPSTIPGLLPMILGLLLAVCAILLFFSADKEEGADNPILAGGSLRALGITALLCLVYGGAMVGNMPFFLATAVFITVFSLIFTWQAGDVASANLRRAVIAIVLGVVSSGAISVMFEQGFLVRLP